MLQIFPQEMVETKTEQQEQPQIGLQVDVSHSVCWLDVLIQLHLCYVLSLFFAFHVAKKQKFIFKLSDWPTVSLCY